MRILQLIIFGLFLGGSGASFAQSVEIQDEQVNPNGSQGRDKAAGYFRDRKKERPAIDKVNGSAAAGAKPRFLAIRAGTFFTDQSYAWGKRGQSDSGQLNVGVDYRLGEWVNAADVALRIDYTNYTLREGSARKLAVQALFTFPDANSRFPLYFGLSVGPGFFIKQIRNESVLAFDYGLLAGARVLDVYQKVGLMAEIGIKDHLLLLSDGQFNGFYFNVGCVFAF